MNDRLRRGLLIAVPVLCLVGTAVATMVSGVGLDERVAMHWSAAGEPDGFGPLWVPTVVTLVVTATAGLGAAAASARVRGPAASGVGALAVGLPLFLTVLHLGTLASNRAVAPAEAPLPVVALVVGLALLAGGSVLGWWLCPTTEANEVELLEVEELEVARGEAVVWSGTATAGPWSVALAVAIVLVGVVVAVVELVIGGLVVLTGLAVSSLLRVRTTVGPSGIVVRFGPLGLVRRQVPLDEVAMVTAEEVEPMAYGGWGYRVVPGTRAVIVRAGPGLHVERHDGPDLVVTVDGAQRAAGVLRAHLNARPATSS